MTDSNPIVHAAPRQGPWRQTLLPYLLMGLAQGSALWLLHRSPWPAPGAWQSALQGLALTLPAAWYLGDNTPAAWRKRLSVAVAVGLLVGLIGAFQQVDSPQPTGRWSPAQMLPTAVMAFVLVTLSAGFSAGSRRIAYPRLFEQAWRNAFALPIAGTLTGIWWMLLWAGAWLMKSIGLSAMETLLVQPWFDYLVGCSVFGLAMGAVMGRSEALTTLRRFWLNLNSCFLPLALAFAVVWLIALLFTGIEPLFQTRKAALFLFWFCTLTVVFANAAYQDGQDAPVFPRLLSRLGPFCVRAWLVIPALALLGDWALYLRVEQYGWTAGRIWAAAVGLLVTLYALGYALSAWQRQRWMKTLPATNVTVAVVKVVVLLMLLTPLADARRIAVDSQVGRLTGGKVSVSEFDWAYLRSPAPYGRQALDRLAAMETNDEPLRTIAIRARHERDAAVVSAASPAERIAARVGLLEKTEVFPAGAQADPALLQALASTTGGREEQACTTPGEACLLALVDLDGDGVPEALLLSDQHGAAGAVMYARGPEGWKKQGNVMGQPMSMGTWKAALEGGSFDTAPPAWPDLLIGDQRRQIRR